MQKNAEKRNRRSLIQRARREKESQSKTQSYIDRANERLDLCLGYRLDNESSWKIVESLRLRNQSVLTALACWLVAKLEEPTTVRGVMYRLAGVGIFSGTHQKFYDKVQSLCLKLRRAGLLPYEWIVDNIRQTRGVPSWAGLDSFLGYAKKAYRHDFWSNQPDYVCVICEANASAGTLMPVIGEFDVSLHPLGGQPSETFIHEIAMVWKEIAKPIYVYYFGDLNPRGMHIEEKTRQELEKMSGHCVFWKRLGVDYRQAIAQNLPRMKLKGTENKTVLGNYLDQYDNWGCELESLPSTQLREVLQRSIESHIDMDAWKTLKDVEASEVNLLRLVEAEVSKMTSKQLQNLEGVNFQ